MIPTQAWVYRGRLVRVIDGDTIVAVVDLGFGLELGADPRLPLRLRLLGVNCPEVHGPTRDAGLAASAYTADWLAMAGNDPWPLLIQTVKPDDFGRYLASVWRTVDGASLNDDLLSSGHAVPYMVP